MTLASPLFCLATLVFSTCLIAQQPPSVATPQPQISDSEEMKTIFIADQLDRGNNPFAKGGDPQPTSLPGPEIRKNDDARKSRVKALLENGTIRTAPDFYRAALVFQHSGTPDGQLLAHVLASVAAERGYSGALWLMAATLDRYLNQIGKKQLFGTQFHSVARANNVTEYDFVQSDVEPGLINDSLRAAFCVQPLSEQRKGLPGPPRGTSLAPCPATEELRKHFAVPVH